MTIMELANPVQNYDWGCDSDIPRLFGIENTDGQPMAEIWMGAHPKAPSMVLVGEEKLALDQLISQEPEHLGQSSVDKFGKNLPFLFKVLSAAKPLSIQTHPNQQQAQEGFQKENDAGIELGAFNRNYRDDNHKPELVYALTQYKAMNGFRPLEEMIELFGMAELAVLEEPLKLLRDSSNDSALKHFYQTLMTLPEEKKQQLVKEALAFAQSSHHSVWQEVKHLNDHFPGDIGILSPLLLNVITLSPGQAMFLKAGTLHAYMKGTGLEIMACSDNVLRGGLTSKHVDIDELLRTVEFTTIREDELLLSPEEEKNGETVFDTPVDDFLFSIISPEQVTEPVQVQVAEILFCIEGKQTIVFADNKTLELVPGASCFVSATCGSYEIQGSGRMARAVSR